MKVRDVMVKGAGVCGADSNLAAVAEVMWKERCGTLPVLDSSGRVMSMITDRDICIALGTRNVRASDIKVKDVSLPRVFTCQPDDDIRAALKTMESQNVRRLPVVDNVGNLCGIISVDDVLYRAEKRARSSSISYEEVINAMKSILEHRLHGHSEHHAEAAVARL
jgi:CBS domain-containing protein